MSAGSKRTVAVLLGGDSAERDVSISSGASVARYLEERGHRVLLLDPVESPEPFRVADLGEKGAVGRRPPEAGAAGRLDPGVLLRSVNVAGELGAEVVFNALHGGSGEDGRVQAVLELAGVPYTGSGVLASALCMDKDVSKRLFLQAGVPTPRWFPAPVGSFSEAEAAARRLAEEIGFPAVVKPNDQGSSVGFEFVESADGAVRALERAGGFGGRVMVEEYVAGREITVGILEGEPLPVLEIIPEGGFFDYERKYTKGTTRYEAPAAVPPEIAGPIRETGRRAYEALGCASYGRVDMRLAAEGRHFVLEVNSLPGMTATSLVPMAAAAAGIEFGELVERIVNAAIAGDGGRTAGKD